MRESDLRTEHADPGSARTPAVARDGDDVWSMLAAIAADGSTDPGLRSLVEAAIASQNDLRGVAIAIATRYRSLIDAVPDAVTVHDESGHIIDANSAACRIFGYQREELQQLAVADLNPSLPADHMQRLLASARLGSTHTVETINRRRDGHEFPVEVHSAVYIDGGEKRIVAVARDIGARKDADAELRASEARFRLLMQVIDKGVVVQDQDGRIESCNPAACRILGRKESELQAMSAEQIAQWRVLDEHGDPVDVADLPSWRALRTGQTISNTVYGLYLPHLGSQRWLSITSVPQFAEGNPHPFRVVSAFDDVTSMKREAELFAQTQVLANIGGWQFDFGDDLLAWTSQVYVIFDLPAQSRVTLERMGKFFPGDARQRLLDAIANVRRGNPIELELRMTSAIGRRRWVRIVARPIRHGDDVPGLSGTLQDITERKLVEDGLRKKALSDPLTGLPNRDALLEIADAAIAGSTAEDGPTLLYLNLDRFRAVNDMLGYGAGDRLLAVAAKRLRDCLPQEAICARFSGDEFMVLVSTGSTLAESTEIAKRLAAEFDRPFMIDEHEFRLTISIGFARFPDDGATVQQLVSHAGAAMVEAKRRGRNNWQRYSPSLARRVSNRLRIESQLRTALEANEFHLEFQPQIDLGSREVISAEALLRWNSRELGDLRPDLFVPYAENNGDIVAIGAWTIREACRQLRAWRDDGLAFSHIAVNVSYRQVLGGTLANTVIGALREYDLPGEALELELTERVLIEDLSDSQQTFAVLQGLGVKMVFDDFGEGYSALGYLRRLPIDGLKISHGFMQNVPGSAPDTAICEAIIRIGQSLGLTVIAEGIETQQQLDFLLARGARLGQGYLFSRPLGPAAFAEFVHTRNGPAKMRGARPA